ncbi:MAG: hypothetical protein JWL73_2592 [Actinomycetia bacterium]|nr:hypothetical protein [Actinomycetes bacterium]
MLRRFEIYSLREGAPADAVARLRLALRDCARYIPEVLHSAIGTNIADNALEIAWEHAYESPEAYQRYMVHPFHAGILDRYLMAGPERVTSDNGLGAGIGGYECDTPVYFQPSGVRRIVMLQIAPDATTEQLEGFSEAVRNAPEDSPELTTSVFAENGMATRWFDGVTPVTAAAKWTHLWEQGFVSLDACKAYLTGPSALAEAERGRWADWLDGIVLDELHVTYELEPGFGYNDSLRIDKSGAGA